MSEPRPFTKEERERLLDEVRKHSACNVYTYAVHERQRLERYEATLRAVEEERDELQADFAQAERYLDKAGAEIQELEELVRELQDDIATSQPWRMP